MKIYRGKIRLAKAAIGNKNFREITEACSLKIGDYIGTCEGFNRKIHKIEYSWMNLNQELGHKPGRTEVIYEVNFVDRNGGMHFFPSPGCVNAPKKPEDIQRWFNGFINSGHMGLCGFSVKIEREMRNALESNQLITDSFGEILPKFDKKNAHE